MRVPLWSMCRVRGCLISIGPVALGPQFRAFWVDGPMLKAGGGTLGGRSDHRRVNRSYLTSCRVAFPHDNLPLQGFRYKVPVDLQQRMVEIN